MTTAILLVSAILVLHGGRKIPHERQMLRKNGKTSRKSGSNPSAGRGLIHLVVSMRPAECECGPGNDHFTGFHARCTLGRPRTASPLARCIARRPAVMPTGRRRRTHFFGDLICTPPMPVEPTRDPAVSGHPAPPVFPNPGALDEVLYDYMRRSERMGWSAYDLVDQDNLRDLARPERLSEVQLGAVKTVLYV